MIRRGYQLLFLKDDSADVVEFGVRRSRLIPLLAGGGVVLLVVVYFGIGFLTDLFYGERISALRRQNAELSVKLMAISSRVERLGVALKGIEAKDDAIRTYANMPSLDQDIREVGVGGSPGGSSTSLDFLLPGSEMSLSAIELDLDKIERVLNLERKSLEDIYSRLQHDMDKFHHTPSIRPTDSGYLNSGFGYRRDPFNGQRRFHYGLDISTRRGRPVYATADGVVAHVGYSPTWGLIVRINHGYGYDTRYTHLSRILVKRNQKVKRGQKIGEVGSTGRSTGPHLHYEVQLRGKPQNPLRYFIYDEGS